MESTSARVDPTRRLGQRLAASARTRVRARLGARQVALGSVVTLLFAPGLVTGPTLDAAVFLVAGWRIRSGEMPYRDVWDHKPPGVFLLHAISEAAVPWLDFWALAWLLSVVATIAAVLCIDAVLRTRAGSLRSAVWSVACAVLLSALPVTVGGGQTETYAVPFVAGAMALLALRPPSAARLAAMGFMLSIACLMSLLAVPATGALGAAAVLERSRGSAPAVLRRLVVFAASAAALPLAVLAWLVAGGALNDAIDQIVRYNAAYRESRGEVLPAISMAVLVLLFVVPFVLLGIVAIVRRGRSLFEEAPLEWSCVAWLAGFVAMIALDGGMYTHYIILVIPAVGVLALEGSGRLGERLRHARGSDRRRAIILTAEAALLAAVSMGVLAQRGVTQFNAATQSNHGLERLAARTAELTRPGDAIFVWGDLPQIYLLADRRPVCRFIYQLPTLTPHYWTPEMTQGMLATWVATPPRAIVEGPGNVSLWPDDTRLRYPRTDGRTFDTLDPLRQFIRDHYEATTTVDGFHIYVLRP